MSLVFTYLEEKYTNFFFSHTHVFIVDRMGIILPINNSLRATAAISCNNERDDNAHIHICDAVL